MKDILMEVAILLLKAEHQKHLSLKIIEHPALKINQPVGSISPTQSSLYNDEDFITPEEAVSQPMESSNVTKKDLYFVRIRYQIVSRLELEATRNVVCTVGMCFIFFLPWIISCVLSLICSSSVHRQYMREEEMTYSQLVEQTTYSTRRTVQRVLLDHFVHEIYITDWLLYLPVRLFCVEK